MAKGTRYPRDRAIPEHLKPKDKMFFEDMLSELRAFDKEHLQNKRKKPLHQNTVRNWLVKAGIGTDEHGYYDLKDFAMILLWLKYGEKFRSLKQMAAIVRQNEQENNSNARQDIISEWQQFRASQTTTEPCNGDAS